MTTPHKSIEVLGTRIDLVQIPDCIARMGEWIESKARGRYVVLSNAYNVAAGRRDPLVKAAANASGLSVPDGISMVMLARMRGHKLKRRVYGPELFLEFMKLSEQKGYANFFYGSTPEILDKLTRKLREKFPGLKIAGYYAPPFRALTPEEDAAVVADINRAAADVVWVGLGGPKQDSWMYSHKDAISAPVMVGIGAAFDFTAGVKPQAPRWVGDSGFEWLFRLITEPRRLWRRYLVDGAHLVYFIAHEEIARRVRSSKRRDHSRR